MDFIHIQYSGVSIIGFHVSMKTIAPKTGFSDGPLTENGNLQTNQIQKMVTFKMGLTVLILIYEDHGH